MSPNSFEPTSKDFMNATLDGGLGSKARVTIKSTLIKWAP
jgi:hypothetical protein